MKNNGASGDTPVPGSFDNAAEALLADLNGRQREAVTHEGGPLLVLAGAGSGKTRVLTHRIAWLVRSAGEDPRRILALTFTNKAANEMKERVEKLLGADASGVWLGTFHSIALRILRRHSELVEAGPGFTVYDVDDQKRLGRKILDELRLDPKKYGVNGLISAIGREKDEGRGPEDALPGRQDKWADVFRAFYASYQKKMLAAGAMDFGDLLIGVLKLFSSHPDVADHYSRRFRHILIDEYQDTNRIQYLIARRIADGWGNIAAVGDDDQSIYGWRGADIGNILSFADRFPGTSIVKLEQNYRSTSLILDAAGSIIKRNLGRMEKTLWTEREGGESVRLFEAATEEEEAAWIATRIAELARGGNPLSSVAVLYRVHALSRPVEDALNRAGLPYVVFGGLRFYERREIKDLLSFLRLAVNPADPVAFGRVVNLPPRGLGDATIQKVADLAAERGTDLWTAARASVEEGILGARAGRAMGAFITMVEGWRPVAAEGELKPLLERIFAESGLKEFLEGDRDPKAMDRLENIEELMNAAETYDEEEEGGPSIFLDRASLVSDLDMGRGPVEAVTLMTVHSAKGLEFKNVFLTAMEEGVFPHSLSFDEPGGIEEERRLCYVAMTRAGERLFLSRSRTRRVYGDKGEVRMPSSFLAELPEYLRPFAPAAKKPLFRDEPWAKPPPAPVPAARPPVQENADAAGGRYYLPEPEEAVYARGMKVRHSKYGAGAVTEASGRGPKARITVRFGDGALRTFLAGPAALEILMDD